MRTADLDGGARQATTRLVPERQRELCLLSLFFLSLKDLSEIPQKQVDRSYYMRNAFSLNKYR
jgi:hypothetical protein